MRILSSANEEDEKILRTKSEEVVLSDIKGQEIQQLIDDLFEASASQEDSAGISAVQIGALKRIFVVEPRVFQDDEGEISVAKKDCIFINPKIVKNSKDKIDFEEGCLSVPNHYGFVNRFKNVTIEAYDGEGKKIKRGAGGLLAIIFQHEIDHLNGVLFTDKARDVRQLTPEEMNPSEYTNF